MGFKNNDRCLDKVSTTEPIFVLRAQDAFAPAVIREWVRLMRTHADFNREGVAVKVDEAEKCAAAMRRWPTRKVPD